MDDMDFEFTSSGDTADTASPSHSPPIQRPALAPVSQIDRHVPGSIPDREAFAASSSRPPPGLSKPFVFGASNVQSPFQFANPTGRSAFQSRGANGQSAFRASTSDNTWDPNAPVRSVIGSGLPAGSFPFTLRSVIGAGVPRSASLFTTAPPVPAVPAATVPAPPQPYEL